MSVALKKATYQDVLDAPDNMVAHLVEGELTLMPRPSVFHGRAASRLFRILDDAFGNGSNPVGWIILFEQEIHLSGDVLVPYVSGWRRETLPELEDGAFIDIRPDWVCEVLYNSYSLKATFADEEKVRAVPFDSHEFDLSLLWQR